MPLPDPFTVLQGIHATIAGVTRSDPIYPTQVNAADLPLVVTEPGPATWEKYTVGAPGSWNAVMRQMTVTVFVKPLGLGRGQDEGFQACLPLMVQFGARYLNDITLGAKANKIDQVTDTGAVVIKSISGQEHWGFVFKFRLWQIFSVSDPAAIPVPKVAHIHETGTADAFNRPPP